MKKLLITIIFASLSFFANKSFANITDRYFCWNGSFCQNVTWYDCYNPYNGYYSPRCTYYVYPAFPNACYSTGAIPCYYR